MHPDVIFQAKETQAANDTAENVEALTLNQKGSGFRPNNADSATKILRASV